MVMAIIVIHDIAQLDVRLLLTKGDVILQIQVIKLQTELITESAGVLKAIHIKPADQVEAKVLVAKWKG